MILVREGTQIWVEDLLVERSRVAGLETEMVNRLVFRLGSTVAGLSRWWRSRMCCAKRAV